MIQGVGLPVLSITLSESTAFYTELNQEQECRLVEKASWDGYLRSMLESLGSVPDSIFLLMPSLGGSRRWFSWLDSCHLRRKTWVDFYVHSLSCCLCECLGTELWIRAPCLCVCLANKQIKLGVGKCFVSFSIVSVVWNKMSLLYGLWPLLTKTLKSFYIASEGIWDSLTQK